MRLMATKTQEFQEKIWWFYGERGRDLPWRRETSPYGVLVSEIMLQQTQVSRVLGRWERWLRRWPSFETLEGARVAEVVEEWQGMGYNRRALRLREAATMVVQQFGGELPRAAADLQRLPGVGPNTAGSVAAFAFNEPVVFIETNIRRVMLHEWFSDAQGVADAELLPVVERTLDRERPREWYWALMDYGADLARREPNANRRSRHYSVQSRFEGSARQLRGEVLRRLLAGPRTRHELAIADGRLAAVLAALEQEGFLTQADGRYELAR